MSKLNKVLVIILVLQYSKASFFNPCFEYSGIEFGEYVNIPDCYNVPSPGYNVPSPGYNVPSPGYNVPSPGYNVPSPGYNVPSQDMSPECPEGQSLISNNDLMALLNYAVRRSNVVKDIIGSYHDKFVAMNNKYLDQLNEFQEHAEDKQEHLKHILESIENLHQKLEPIVQEIVAETDKIDVSEEQVSVVENNLEKLLKKFQMYQDICELNGKNLEPVNTFKNNFAFKSSNANLNSKPICENIEVIYAEAIKQLHQFRDKTITQLESNESQTEDFYKDSVISYNDRLKDGALIQYNKLMYDILKLQDGYFHLNQYFSNFNLSLKLEAVENNTQIVKSMLVEMENNVNEYGKMCVTSVKKLRIKRGTSGSSFKVDYYPEPASSDIINAAISIKIKEIDNIVNNNFTNIFKELKERLTNPEVVESYIQKLAPKEEDIDSVKKASENMDEMKKLIPESTFKKLQDLYRKSEQVLQKAENAKEDIEAKIKSIKRQ